ncbi:hypothetical protein [Arthrobacter sp. HY1533]|uniref:hypothetical protein n=1 Tax=Arthrobacter sp. HY1533 TaxID=2970919 RepID=UPI0022B9F711|nr:hypothetical protein [Arthrobacter sp. HY1533]
MGILNRKPRPKAGLLDYWFNGAQLNAATARLTNNQRILNAIEARKAAGNNDPLTPEEMRQLMHPTPQPEQ